MMRLWELPSKNSYFYSKRKSIKSLELFYKIKFYYRDIFLMIACLILM